MRRKLTFILAVAGVLGLPAAAPGDDFVCRGLMGGVFQGNVIVPEGGTCVLDGFDVWGNLIQRKDSSLVAHNGTVRGNVEGVDIRSFAGDQITVSQGVIFIIRDLPPVLAITKLVNLASSNVTEDVHWECAGRQSCNFSTTNSTVGGNGKWTCGSESSCNAQVIDSNFGANADWVGVLFVIAQRLLVGGNLSWTCLPGQSCNTFTEGATVGGNAEWKGDSEASSNAGVFNSHFGDAKWDNVSQVQAANIIADRKIGFVLCGPTRIERGSADSVDVSGTIDVEIVGMTLNSNSEINNSGSVVFRGNNIGQTASFTQNDSIVVIDNTARFFYCEEVGIILFARNIGEEDGCMPGI